MGFKANITAYAIAAATILGGLAFGTDDAAAQSSLPTFGCTGDIYQVQSGQLRIFDPVTSTYTNIGTNQGSYNATGFNIDNNAFPRRLVSFEDTRVRLEGSDEVFFADVTGDGIQDLVIVSIHDTPSGCDTILMSS